MTKIDPHALKNTESTLRSSRSCLDYACRIGLVPALANLRMSFGILATVRFLSRTGEWSTVDGTPTSHAHEGRTKAMDSKGSIERF